MYDAPAPQLTESELRALDAQYCSWGDTVHYLAQPKFFETCEGSYMYDAEGRAYLDLQMWYSTANFGYRNPRLNAAAHRQLDTLPQIASQHLHREKVELAALIARDAEAKFGARGRVHFNVGGAQAIEDSLKVVRNAKDGKGFMFAFQGGYHGRTLGASAITSSYRYRRRYGHFGDRAHFVEFPYAFRGPKGMSKEEYGDYCVRNFARLFESEFHGVSDPRAGESEFAAFYAEPIQGTGGYVIPPKNFFIELKKVLDQHGILLVVDEVQMGIWRTGKLWSIEHFGVQPDVLVFGKAVTNGLNPLSGLWAREELINPEVFPPGATHSTFNANPMGTAVALETLRMAAEGDYDRTVPEKGAYFLAGLQELQKRWPQIGDVDGLGLALRAELCGADGFTPDKSLLDRMVAEGLKGDLDVGGKKMGLILNVGGYYKNVITFAPSLDITHEEIDLALKLLDALLRRCVTT
ncbi:MAG TPA: aminotransferase class III-fold pyridoxal phosphate-dependent enzyme [Phenylobacterium sp.]|jgi:4-aminobutyrate aminotransferase/(S)-3-amino-2-methylpropionate transaminase|uniref:aspartate aminotransferase family protein n=1 Tax=Phenylobacterium sp. TaxID=1871053 RepID=UPI002C3294FC|nr:aminotransferase class III-fold pyridoxal phosphate-dependent enzyme [Phenylobacterium sp.]HXA41042.1 aminotransferase class III-fold pyridoxal phosphate-dependent enzyme [Phenylobacterium sp.]